MLIATAIELVNQLVYKPGWTIMAGDATNRHESTIRVRIEYPAQETSREEARNGYQKDNHPYAQFYIIIDPTCDDVSLYRHIAERIMEIEQHEMREYLRVEPTYWAPFHPHQIDGMKRWHGVGNRAGIESDLMFGAA
jgi:hypothetical protein